MRNQAYLRSANLVQERWNGGTEEVFSTLHFDELGNRELTGPIVRIEAQDGFGTTATRLAHETFDAHGLVFERWEAKRTPCQDSTF